MLGKTPEVDSAGLDAVLGYTLLGCCGAGTSSIPPNDN